MKKRINYFTLGEITLAIAILGVGLLGVLGVFPVAIQNGARAVKLSDSLHKARAVADLVQNFGLVLPAESSSASKEYHLPPTFLNDSGGLDGWFADDSSSSTPANMNISFGESSVINQLELADHQGNVIKSASGRMLLGTCMGSEKLELRRYVITVNEEFDTTFYAFHKNP